MNRILAILLLTALPAMGQTYCMVTGHLSRALSLAYTNMTLTFTPQSTPLIDNPLLVSGATVTTTSTAPVGYFTINLEHGIYKVQIGGLPRDIFTITIPPDVNETNHISTYITSGATTNFVPGSVSGWTQTASDSRYVKLTNGVAVKPVLSNNTATAGWVWTATNAAGAGHWAVQTGGAGESTSVSSLSVTNSTTFPITIGLSGTDIPFKTFRAGANMVITNEGTNLTFASAASGGGITGLNGLSAATQTFAVGTAGSDFAISSVTSTHTFNLPTASGSVRGALASADWTTFNGKATEAFVYSIGANLTNFGWTLGANATSHVYAIGANSTNFAYGLGANATNFTYSIGANNTNFAYTIGANATSFVYSIGANTTNYASARQGGDAVLTNLVGTVARNVTNVVSLSTTNATSKPLTNSYTAGVLTLRGIEAGANVTITANASNYVIASSASASIGPGALDFNLTQFDTNGNVSIKSGALVTNLDHYGSLDLLDTPGANPGQIGLFETNGVKASYWQSHWTNHWNLTNRLSTATNSQTGWALTVHGIDAAGTLTTWTNTAVTNWVKVTGSSDITATGSGSGGVQTFNITADSTLTRDAEIDTEAELQTIWGSVNILLETEIDASSELRALMDDESGTGALLFADGAIGAATATTPSANDNDTSVATTAFVQTELGDYQLIDTELTEWAGVGTNKNLFTNSLVVAGGSGGITTVQSISGGVVTWTVSDDDAGGGSLTSNNLSRVTFTNYNSIATNYVREDNYRWSFYDSFNRPNTTNGLITPPPTQHSYILDHPALGTLSTNVGRIEDGTVKSGINVASGTNGTIYIKTTMPYFQPIGAAGMRWRHVVGNGGSTLGGVTVAISSAADWSTKIIHFGVNRDGMTLDISTNGVGNMVPIGYLAWPAMDTNVTGTMQMEFLGNNAMSISANGVRQIFTHRNIDEIGIYATNIYFQISNPLTNLYSTFEMEAIWAGDSSAAFIPFNTNQFSVLTNGGGVYPGPIVSINNGASLTNANLYTATNSGQFLVGGTVYASGGVRSVNSLVSGIATNGGLRVSGTAVFEDNLTIDAANLVMDISSIGYMSSSLNVGGLLTVTNQATFKTNITVEGVIGTAYDSTLRLNGTNVGAAFMLSVPNNAVVSNKLIMDVKGFAAGHELVAHSVSGATTIMTNLAPRYRTIYINSGAMMTNSTQSDVFIGAVFSNVQGSAPTNRVSDYYVFSDAITNSVQYEMVMPQEWDLGTLKFKFDWTTTNAVANQTNVWAVSATAFSNDDPQDAAWVGTNTVKQTVTAANDRMLTDATAAYTVSGTPALGDVISFRFFRLGAHAEDAMSAGQARLRGVWVQYQESATRPAAW